MVLTRVMAFAHVTLAWVTRPERPKGLQLEVLVQKYKKIQLLNANETSQECKTVRASQYSIFHLDMIDVMIKVTVTVMV